MTVKELRDLLAGLPDDAQVSFNMRGVLSTENFAFSNPDPEEEDEHDDLDDDLDDALDHMTDDVEPNDFDENGIARADALGEVAIEQDMILPEEEGTPLAEYLDAITQPGPTEDTVTFGDKADASIVRKAPGVPQDASASEAAPQEPPAPPIAPEPKEDPPLRERYKGPKMPDDYPKGHALPDDTDYTEYPY